MEEMLNKFIDEGKQEHDEMRAFIYDFQTNNELLFKERNNSLIELSESESTRSQELLANEEPNSFLSRGLEKSIDQSDLEFCEFASSDEKNGSDSKNSIRRIDSTNTSQCYEIDEKKPELKNLPQHLEYAYLYGDKSFPIIISSELSKKEKISLLQVLERRKGAIA
ncbi:hypothetical protein Tco_0150916 [Tanacetum coccineum]